MLKEREKNAFVDAFSVSLHLILSCPQRAKKVLSDSPGLVDFAIGLGIFVLNLPDGQVLFFGEIQITEGKL